MHERDVEPPPRVRWGVLLAIVGVSAVIFLALIMVTVFRALDPSGGGPALSRAARDEIEHANCRQLSTLAAVYTPNGDSVEPDATALRLTRVRQTELHCPTSN